MPETAMPLIHLLSILSEDLRVRAAALEQNLQGLGAAAVCFSGGVDSTLLLAFASRVLGAQNVLAVVGDSETLARAERSKAVQLGRSLGVRVEIVMTREMEDDRFTRNPEDRCFFCKDELFQKVRALARSEGIAHVLDGTNADDLSGHRPGRRAADLHGVASPLAAAGLTKNDVRELSRALGLPTWDKPSLACLASRFPHGQRITPQGLARVEEAEDHLRRLGFRNVRVRDHGGLARIEVDADRVEDLVRLRIHEPLKALGFEYVTVDLEGFRSGSLSPAAPGGDSSGETP